MIGVLLNPNALGVRRRHDLGDRFRAILGPDGVLVETRTIDEVPAAVARFAEIGCDPVGICGGDGTNLSTVTGYMHGIVNGHGLPRFLLLPGGTVNTVAKNLRIRGGPEQVLRRTIEQIRAGAPLREIELEAIEVNGRFGFLFAAAMGARFLEAYYKPPGPSVPWAMALGARTVVSSLLQGSWARALFQPAAVELRADGEPVPLDRVRVLCAASVQDLGIGMRLMWRAGTERGRFHFIATSISTTRMALQMDRVLRARPLEGDHHVDRLARELHIRFAEEQPYTLDGDLFRAREIVVRAGPRVRIVTP